MTVSSLLAYPLLAQATDYSTPAGTRPARRTEDGAGTVLPGGRQLNPFGKQFTTGSGPFGLTISPTGTRVITANAGQDLLSLTFLENSAGDWHALQLNFPKKRDPNDEHYWKSAFMGLAFDNEQILYPAEGDSGQVRAFDRATGKWLRRYTLNAGGFDDSYSGDMAFDSERGLLHVLDQANFRIAVFDVRRAHRPIASVRVGRLPFAVVLSPDRKRLYARTPDFTPYDLQAANLAVFDPAKAKKPLDPKPSPRMDDPKEVKRGR